ncbi:PIN domain nuclease [Sphaerisporangium rhizosphaerae]|uniref:Ribonuclease VapC n=1 Tax=Sphaerisporangium rhizosphaerae TaxID=2269375 RepID=A0ABW2PA96_9ACTN
MATHYLIDSSALWRMMRNEAVRDQWHEETKARLISLCPLVEIEMFFGVRCPRERREWRDLFHAMFGWVFIPDRVYERAIQTQELMIELGQHRCASPVDLLVAATGELNGLTILHYDRDYETIAKVTGQPVEWLAPPGSLN